MTRKLINYEYLNLIGYISSNDIFTTDVWKETVVAYSMVLSHHSL
jgi:hypothetical protein